MAEEVKVLGFWASPYSRRVELALKVKGIQYEYIEEDLRDKSGLLLKYNPVHKQIPVIVHNGKPIAESLVVLEYIDDTWPQNPILPKDPFRRASARFWAKFVDEKIMQAIMRTKTMNGEELKQAREEIFENVKLLEGELKGKELFGDDMIGYLDIVAFVIAHWLQVLHEEALEIEFITEAKYPALHKWIQKLREIDWVKECLPPRDKHVTFIKARIEALKSASK